MKQNEFDELIKYVLNWQSIDGLKPNNEPIFVIEFANLLDNFPDEREIEFDGDGAYFGKQITVRPFSYYGKHPRELEFEIAYDENNISVYSAHHHGFWYPEFIRFERAKHGDDFIILLRKLMKLLITAFGVKTNI